MIDLLMLQLPGQWLGEIPPRYMLRNQCTITVSYQRQFVKPKQSWGHSDDLKLIIMLCKIVARRQIWITCWLRIEINEAYRLRYVLVRAKEEEVRGKRGWNNVFFPLYLIQWCTSAHLISTFLASFNSQKLKLTINTPSLLTIFSIVLANLWQH